MEQHIATLTKECPIIYQNMLDGKNPSADQLAYLDDVIALLDKGLIRVSEFQNDNWQVNQWIKQAIVAYIHYKQPDEMADYKVPYRDHTPYKYSISPIRPCTRIVPPSHIRYGAYIGKKSVIMPSFINIGAYIDDGSMVDSFASVGSGAQIGKNVHISAGAGIGGVLEPMQALPTIIEDNCFIGARSEVSEGMIVRQGAVLSSGMFISQSTRIYNRMTQETSYGEIPENAVVVPGTIPAPDQSHHIYAAIIVKYADAQTRTKTQINDLLRPTTS
ncbi:2,3,4,5-tetrahydropyridine-2,6-dicarboxylate N-succinyltransferase [Candidatus Synchoanobacter obligatus]|uniref:2,3,4,5-tetrahydropyridine-2,6-dicarboxylate N-succinyltransferase n=1 Tax=Candidatus Synchoanobacter obligatus TaxID=2919597 RepID=A0ABT1L5K3_9GAMM|nr:2,3,4,5-tetrahydropyridine-2,6-dicarboxylate N-succinyltransferase [Candidatus Synchoanobacter obligatus]MCP8352452.1 2,3,4,5-tetrahydropyridine-2,6-dicarboxylate N-succinyltransferase [Candidatus Synchoanobacter obligatus]